jgi:hypothetical protein
LAIYFGPLLQVSVADIHTSCSVGQLRSTSHWNVSCHPLRFTGHRCTLSFNSIAFRRRDKSRSPTFNNTLVPTPTG